MNRRRFFSKVVSIVVVMGMVLSVVFASGGLNTYAGPKKTNKVTAQQRQKVKKPVSIKFYLGKDAYKVSLPKTLKLTQPNKNEAKLNRNGKIAGGINLIGCQAGKPETALPNHSQKLKEEKITSKLGTGKLYTIKMSNPAAQKKKEWIEIHAVVPIAKKNFAYDIWIKTTQKKVINEINTLKKIVASIEKTK